MRNTPTSNSKGWLVSCWSRLLMALLSSWSPLSWWAFVRGRLLSCSSLSCLSFWLFDSWSFHCSSRRSNSWFYWVSRSTATTKVCTCLSNALGRFSVSWLVVAIDLVRTIQLFVFETAIWLITRCSHRWRQLMMCWNRQWVVGSKSLQWVLVEEEQMDQTEGTSVVPAKNPPKVKLVNEKFLRTL